MSSRQASFRNLMIASMAEADFATLEPLLERVHLPLGEEVEKPSRPLEYAYFLESGLASTIASMSRGRDIEVGVIGWEGFVGSSLVLWDDEGPFRTYIQIPGEAFRVPSAALMELMDHRPQLRRHLARFTRVLGLQVVSTAWTNGHTVLENRLARWLLMVHDRIDGQKLTLTHEFLSIMLGVRRPGVTVALHLLEGKGLIRSHRSEITIIDREGLKRQADGSYGRTEAEYERLLGWRRR